MVSVLCHCEPPQAAWQSHIRGRGIATAHSAPRNDTLAPTTDVGWPQVWLMPGVAGVVELHPYEYIYFNQWVGGTRGGRKVRHGLLVHVLSRGSVGPQPSGQAADEVALVPTFTTTTSFLREDLHPISKVDRVPEPDFALACRRWNGEPLLFPDLETIYEVRADGAL